MTTQEQIQAVLREAMPLYCRPFLKLTNKQVLDQYDNIASLLAARVAAIPGLRIVEDAKFYPSGSRPQDCD